MAASASAQASRPPSAGKSGLGKPRTTVSDLLAAVRRKKTRQQARQLRRVESEVATTAEAESHPGTEAPATDSATALPGKGQVLRRHTSIRNATHAVAAALSMAAGAAHPTEGQPTAEHERHPRTLSGAAVAAIISLFALIYAFARYSVTVSAEELLGLPMTIAHQVVHAYQSWPEILAFSIGVMLVQLIDHAIRRLLLRLVFASELSQSPLDDVLVRMAIVFFPAPASAQQAHDELKGAASHFGVDLSDDESLSSDDSDSSEESEGVFGSLQHRLSRRLGGKVATRGRQGSKTPPSAKAPPLRSIFFAKAVDVATWPSTVEEHVAVTTANLVLGVCLGVFLSLSICMEDECDDAAPQPTAGSPATPQPVTVTKGLLSSIAGVALTMRLAVPVDHASTLLVSDFLAIGTAVGAGGHRTFANFVSAFRIVLWMLVLLVVIKILGGDVSAMIQGLGFLGFGLAFAMQKTIQDAVVALVLFMDKPFVVGDLIDIGNGAMGTVKKVHLRYTVLSLLDSGQLMRVANTDLANARIQNFAGHTERRVYCTISIDLDADADQLDSVPRIVEESVKPHSEARFVVACLKEMVPTGHVFEYIYMVSGDRATERRVKHAVGIAILRGIRAQGMQLSRLVAVQARK